MPEGVCTCFVKVDVEVLEMVAVRGQVWHSIGFPDSKQREDDSVAVVGTVKVVVEKAVTEVVWSDSAVRVGVGTVQSRAT